MTEETPLLHEECWLLLPWLANGRLQAADRARVEQHMRECAQCAQETAWQRVACQALAEPDRVTYAPGPSFRKLMEGIDRRSGGVGPRIAHGLRRAAPSRAARAAWRPPGFAWAASFLLVITLGTLAPLAYRWSQPLYVTHTAPAARGGEVLHVAFERSLPIGDVEELLRSAGARVVEGPGDSGIFGVAPVGAAEARGVTPQMRALAARLRADPRVRWVEPLAVSERSGGALEPRAPSR
jgi:hypothetical protein